MYNEAISKYKNKTSSDNDAIIHILEYLKKNEIYYVDIFFKNENRIKDLNKNNNFKVISAQNSFSPTKNKPREQELINTLNQTLGSFFPSDIISIEDVEDRDNIPRFEITYTYSNSEDGSFYYPVSQEILNENERDYYYGLTILWDFSLLIPTENFFVYNFTLSSNPAIQFSTDSNSTDNVYSNMVYSAFRDFANEFDNHFIGNTSKELN